MESGHIISVEDGRLKVPSEPVIPYIEGDGIGVDITPVTISVIDSGVKQAYRSRRKIQWKKVLAGDEAFGASGVEAEALLKMKEEEAQKIFLPDETLDSIRRFKVALKGPLTTPVASGFRSLNVALRRALDLFACIRPVKWYRGVPTPLKNPELLDVVIFRENTEDVYAGIEWPVNSSQVSKVRYFLNNEMGCSITPDSAIGVKPVSITGTKRLVRAAIQHAIDNNRRSVTLVHKGNIMKHTEGAFMKWGYEVATQEFRKMTITEEEYTHALREKDNTGLSKDFPRSYKNHGYGNPGSKILIKDRIADQMFQQLLLRPNEYDVIATLNLNGDYLSDLCAAEVGGLGIAPGANVNNTTGLALFEPTHGTAPKYAGLDKVNPSSMILSAVMMLNYLGWHEAADIVEKALQRTIEEKIVTYDLHRQMKDATLVTTSAFGREVVSNIMPTVNSLP